MKTYNQRALKAKLFKALADPIRIHILEALYESEKCVCEISEELQTIQPLVSRHLRILREAGVLVMNKSGTKRLYKISSPKIRHIIESIDFSLLEHIAQQISLEIMK